jgi:hypothetical protein
VTDCLVVAIVGDSNYPCRSHEDGKHHFAVYWPACPAPFCRSQPGHRGLHDVPAGRAVILDLATVNLEARGCARCRRVLVDEDETGWYYQAPVTDPDVPGLTFMDRVHECDGQPHKVISRIELARLEQDDAYIAEHGNDDLETGHTRDPGGDEAAHG